MGMRYTRCERFREEAVLSMRKILASVLGIAGSLLVAAAGLSPNDAATNLKAWIELFGFSHVPKLLEESFADYVALVIGLICICLAAFVYFRNRGEVSQREQGLQRDSTNSNRTAINATGLNNATITNNVVIGADLLKAGEIRDTEISGNVQFSGQSTTSNKVDRISLLELKNMAIGQGWRADNDSLEMKDLADGLRQAFLDGEIKVWGRPYRNMFDTLNRKEPLFKIEMEHWREFSLEFCLHLETNDNFEFKTFSHSHYQHSVYPVPDGYYPYADLHLDRESALAWLSSSAKKFKGTNVPRLRHRQPD